MNTTTPEGKKDIEFPYERVKNAETKSKNYTGTKFLNNLPQH